jgi:predicted enzyme related to lactoylglutathione lyase
MGTRTAYEPGTFCWVDLSTPDVEGAKAFYRGLFGWEIEDRPGPHGTFSMAHVGGERVAAFGPQAASESERGIPPHWNNYVSVEDAAATQARAAELGAELFGEAFDVGEEGRIGVFRDPTGAHLCLWQPGEHVGAGRVNEPGCLTWNEAGTPDPGAARAFYEELFGWGTEEMDTDGAPSYTIVTVGERSNGGIREHSAEERGAGVPPAWMPYFVVLDSVAEAIERTGELGGQVLAGPIQLPNGGTIAAIADPPGAALGLWEGPLDD